MSAIAAFALRPRCTTAALERAVELRWTGGRIGLREVRGEVFVELGWFVDTPEQYEELERTVAAFFELSRDGLVYYYRNAEMARADTEVPERPEPIRAEEIARHRWLQPTMEYRSIERIRVLSASASGEPSGESV